MKMRDEELLAIVESAEKNAVSYNDEFQQDNEYFFNSYLGEPYGDEVEGQSSQVATDVADVIEADMPSLVRVFLGSGDIIKFESETDNEEEQNEAEEKTKYINYLVRNQKKSFKKIIDWIKDAEIQKCGVVKYFCDEIERTEEREYDGVSEGELAQLMEDLKAETKRGEKVKLEVLEQNMEDPEDIYLKFKLTYKKKEYRIENVPTEGFLISRNAKCKDTAELVGDKFTKSRSDLIQEGFDEELVKSLPTYEGRTGQHNSNMEQARAKAEGDHYNSTTTYAQWAAEDVEIFEGYQLVDFDGDNVAERRKIWKCGNKILKNEPFPHVPYAIMSAITMPHRVIGRSRAEITAPHQKVQTFLRREVMNNIALVNSPRHIVNDDNIEVDDFLVDRLGGMVRTSGIPQQDVFTLEIPYIGDKTLQVIQYMDSARAQSTGSLQPNQGLQADQINKETATRFNGVQESSAAKIELIARVYAETGFTDLYEGMAWLVSQYQDTETEIKVLGKPLTVNPSNWKYEHRISSSVGLGAGDSREVLENMASLWQIHQGLQQNQSPLTDPVKQYNILSRIVKNMGIAQVDDYANNPEIPEETLMAQFSQMQQQMQQMQQALQQQNPLAQAEQVKGQINMARDENKNKLEIAKIQVEEQSKDKDRAIALESENKDLATKLTELELKYNRDVPGAVV